MRSLITDYPFEPNVCTNIELCKVIQFAPLSINRWPSCKCKISNPPSEIFWDTLCTLWLCRSDWSYHPLVLYTTLLLLIFPLPYIFLLPCLCLCLFLCLCRPGGQLWLGAYHEFILWHYSSPPPLSNRSLWVMSYSAQALSWYIFAWTGFEASIQQNWSFASKLRGGDRAGNGILHSIFTMYYGQPVFVLKICCANDWLTPCFSHRSLLFMIPLLQQ